MGFKEDLKTILKESNIERFSLFTMLFFILAGCSGGMFVTSFKKIGVIEFLIIFFLMLGSGIYSDYKRVKK